MSRGRQGHVAKKYFLMAVALLFGATCLCATVDVAPAQAKKHLAKKTTTKKAGRRGRAVALRADPGKDAALIIDGISGKVLYARNANEIRHPASLTKMMTLYLLFDAIRSGQVSMDTTLTFSAHAASQHPTNMHVGAGERMDVETAINALVVRSANDVAVMVGEALGGSEPHFAEMMTAKAQSLGMRNTVYRNASGLPDPGQVTTAADLSILARRLSYDFPQFFHYFGHREFSWRGNRYIGHDNLLGRYPGADGMKTGYTGMSGFNLVSSVTRGNTHIIGVVMGGTTAASRDTEMMRLLDVAFDDISQSPRMVAHAQLPWQSAQAAQQAAQVASVSQKGLWRVDRDGQVTPIKRGQYVPQNDARGSRTLSDADDEDTAEARTALESLRPMPRPKDTSVKDSGTAVAAYMPRPQMAPHRPAQKAVRPETTADAKTPETGMHDWTIQIGAYNDLGLARSQLTAYAEKSLDVLGQAQKIVIPYQSPDGHMVYRARFGPFQEREAKQICARLTERGQTCFAAVSTR